MALPLALCVWLISFLLLRYGPLGDFLVAAFCHPPVILCGFYLGLTPNFLSDGGAYLSCASETLLVGRSCSAMNFFFLLSLAMLYVSIRSRRGFIGGLTALGVSYLLTIALNSCRLLCVWKCLGLFGSEPFGVSGTLFHYLLGASVFWPMLVIAPLLFNSILKHKGLSNAKPSN